MVIESLHCGEGGNPSAISHQPSATGFKEWGYAERAWYLEDRRGLSGILRALLWPTEGVVEAGRYDRVWAQRTQQPPSELFVFRLIDEGNWRLRRHLQTTITSLETVARSGRAAFYPGARAYHLFHTCHQYAAHALRAGGLPISAFLAFNRTSLAWQLRRTARISEQQSMAGVLAMNRANDQRAPLRLCRCGSLLRALGHSGGLFEVHNSPLLEMTIPIRSRVSRL